MTNQEIMRIALEQSAYDCGCAPEDFLSEENKVVLSRASDRARKYIPLPLECDLVSYGNNIVAQVSERTADVVRAYIQKYSVAHCFETPNLHVLDENLRRFDLKVCFMAEYFLPDMTLLKRLPCEYELRVLQQSDLTDLYTEKWSNALTFDQRERDVLAVGAYGKGRLVGLAGCSADCGMMYQIGVDVLPEYRRKGIAAALTSNLPLEILALGKVPFYCAAWSNIRSVRNAIKAGILFSGFVLFIRQCIIVENIF